MARSKREYSVGIAEAVKNFLTEDEWRFDFDEQEGIFRFGLSLDGKIKEIRYLIIISLDDYTVYATSPIGVEKSDDKMLSTMAEFVCRVNYGLKNGNFELDLRDGEIRYKCYVDCDSTVPNPDVIGNSLYCPAHMFERYGIGIIEIMFANATAAEAVERCENTE